MSSRLTEVIVDCRDLQAIAGFWCEVLGYSKVHSGDGWLAIGPPTRPESLGDLAAAPPAPVVAFVVVPESKVAKNRVHIDVTPFDCTQSEEVERLIGLGARHVDIGQVDTSWVVMADPEGNEFCVMQGTESA